MNLCVTADRHWAIGKDGRPLVTIPADRQMFLKETVGKVVVMGRRTLEGLPGGQPFGNRVNIVLTHALQYKVKGAVVCHSLEEALKALKDYDEDDIYIIGGESIYRQFLPYCTTAHVTRIDYTHDGDAYFPDLEEEEGWQLAEEGDAQNYVALCHTFRRFRRKQESKNCPTRSKKENNL